MGRNTPWPRFLSPWEVKFAYSLMKLPILAATTFKRIGTPLAPKYHNKRSQRMYNVRNILLPTDFSAYSAFALEHALTFSIMYGARLHVLHVAKEPEAVEIKVHPVITENLPASHGDRTSEELHQFVLQWVPSQSKVIEAVKIGQPYREIVQYAEEEEIDLIVIATHGRTGLPHLMTGSVAEKVVRYSTKPVLTVKPPRMAEEDDTTEKPAIESSSHVIEV